MTHGKVEHLQAQALPQTSELSRQINTSMTTRSGPRRLAPSSLPRALAKATRALPLGADRAAAAAAASRALSRPAPQGPSAGPVRAPPSRGPGGPAPVPRGPRLLVPAAPGARSPARAAPPAAGERGRATRKLTRTYTVHVCGLHSVSLGGCCFRLYDSLLFLHVLGNILRHGVEQMAEHS
ncbi:translation initiation factor IF-2-like [Phocoena sinus]|uniref:translation initiation factor IF-2-like n=1 Tax=Phocoena sinus TaxID=42100 RepID=UPI0013C3E4A5|nr:translation initiation factor IF-2-like [Phocoena sinus]